METSFLSGTNAIYIAEVYSRYLEDPSSVDPSWVSLFDEFGDELGQLSMDLDGPSWAKRGNAVVGTVDPDAPPPKKDKKAAAGGVSEAEMQDRARDSIRALLLVRAYRVRGHLLATMDPLKLQKDKVHPELGYEHYGFTEADLDRNIYLDNVLGMESATLRQIMEALRATYCGSVGVEFLHMQDPVQKKWIQERIESDRNRTQFTKDGKKAILERLTEAEGFEKFLQMKYTGTKRFGLEGGESMVPALEQILKRGTQLGLEEVNIGMAHRGRLNILTSIMHKPYRAIFSEFQGNSSNPEDVQGSGDVKYHLGTSADREFDGKTIHLSLQANPSHLEAVDPVVLGKVRAKQTQISDKDRKKVMAILIHGDAAFAGQGLVAECFGMSDLVGYRTGGTMHLVINNQIGFTTLPQYSRSGTYCSDIAKMVMAPIFHVNGDDPEAVVHVARIATEFRQEFGIDVVVDMVCYRRHGHNEIDEPAFTQPVMYKAIAKLPTTRTLYEQRLVQEGSLTQDEVTKVADDFTKMMEEEFEAGSNYKPNKADWLLGKWEGLEALAGEEEYRQENTAVSEEMLKQVGTVLSTPPENFDTNRKIVRQMKAKAEMLKTGQGFDWAMGEALAFGTLLKEGTPVRLSGQDSGRGTFSHRHSVLVDQTNEDRYRPLDHISADQGHFEVIDSPLSEFSVLGFEYGYSLAEPRALVLWEAQFGDFANGAQVIFDQFVSSAESKWLRMSGLVVLLPHGYEGQGPEHSSARPERYLQMCAEDNMHVCNFTTPANYFHGLRRQVKRNFRKPLIVMSPKSLLRHKMCVSTMAEFTDGGFRRVIPEISTDLKPEETIRRVVICTGKLYYELYQAREEQGIDDVVIIRVEQLYPWPKDTIQAVLRRYPNADVIWCQEEPANMGYWMFVDRRLEYALEELNHKARRAFYVGRRAAASPATGSNREHLKEQALLIEQALTWRSDIVPQPFRRATKLSSIGQ